jgi:predicted nucleotide-binding protein
MMKTFAEKIEELVAAGGTVTSSSTYEAWANRVSSLLSTAIDSQAASDFQALVTGSSVYWERHRDRQVGHLEGLALRIEASGLQRAKAEHSLLPQTGMAAASTRVFIVHGHDTATKESAARFLERLELDPIVLHEQPNGGRTIIEKFEAYADVGFAIVLLTPDDVGARAKEPDKLLPRARQNVILELGYFTGRLGRSRVCALVKPGVDVPSDIHGVVFLELDDPGAWKVKLANELVRAGITINVQALLRS